MKTRILTNGTYYRAQVRWMGLWWDLDSNGYVELIRRPNRTYLCGRNECIKALKFREDRLQIARNKRGPWTENN